MWTARFPHDDGCGEAYFDFLLVPVPHLCARQLFDRGMNLVSTTPVGHAPLTVSCLGKQVHLDDYRAVTALKSSASESFSRNTDSWLVRNQPHTRTRYS